ncbi:MAG: hypothetical protein KDK24_04370 [Pseudooceanicola sp.]|nr:hypothetical protein [Pseudooceanicola sp.]
MTNRIAFVLACLILLAALIDGLVFGSEHFLFLGKKLFAFLDWIAFWR